ncbi:OmpA family protein [Rhizobium leguminosarum bv. viciae]|nr:OmpA family protein [Rhizobium leguminosarum bv. viciae]
MRDTGRARPSDEEEESVFISMADMTISFLFIVMILLAFFASQFSASDVVPRDEYERVTRERNAFESELQSVKDIVGSPDLKVAEAVRDMKEELERLRELVNLPAQANQMEVYNTAVAETRKALLSHLKEEIDSRIKGINVQVSTSYDALQFSGDGLFDSGKDVPTAAGEARMRQIAEILDGNLGCYSLGPRHHFGADCNPAYALIDALQVEGHTDNLGGDNLNMDLSARRAASIYSLMTQRKPDLNLFLNRNEQPILSVAGFGKGRPIQDNASAPGRDANRRIDLRFIMVVPSREVDIRAIKDALSERLK